MYCNTSFCPKPHCKIKGLLFFFPFFASPSSSWALESRNQPSSTWLVMCWALEGSVVFRNSACCFNGERGSAFGARVAIVLTPPYAAGSPACLLFPWFVSAFMWCSGYERASPLQPWGAAQWWWAAPGSLQQGWRGTRWPGATKTLEQPRGRELAPMGAVGGVEAFGGTRESLCPRCLQFFEAKGFMESLCSRFEAWVWKCCNEILLCILARSCYFVCGFIV